MLTKTNHAGYEKDVSSNLVINKNKDEYTLYLQNKERAKEFQRMSKEMERITKELSELRTMFQEILKSGRQNG